MNPEPSDEYEEWLPSVIKRWDAFEGGEKSGKHYTAFLRFVFRAYTIPARTYTRWVNNNNRPRSNKHLALQILYDGDARTMSEMRENFREVWDITSAFPPPPCVLYEYNIRYSASQVWERNARNGPAFARMCMCVGKGKIPYIPPELREVIISG